MDSKEFHRFMSATGVKKRLFGGGEASFSVLKVFNKKVSALTGKSEFVTQTFV